MITTSDVLIFCLFVCQIGMMVLAGFYLRGRRLPGIAYLLWGLVAIALPILGPYLVIVSRPGKPNPNPRG
jgi:hypothetical protein